MVGLRGITWLDPNPTCFGGRDEEGVLGRDFLGGGTEYKVVSGLYKFGDRFFD